MSTAEPDHRSLRCRPSPARPVASEAVLRSEGSLPASAVILSRLAHEGCIGDVTQSPSASAPLACLRPSRAPPAQCLLGPFMQILPLSRGLTALAAVLERGTQTYPGPSLQHIHMAQPIRIEISYSTAPSTKAVSSFAEEKEKPLCRMHYAVHTTPQIYQAPSWGRERSLRIRRIWVLLNLL